MKQKYFRKTTYDMKTKEVIIMIFFHHDLNFLIIIGAVTVAATAGILIDFDDCLHHNEYKKWVTNIYI